MFFIRTNDQVKIAVYDLNPCGSETILLIHGWPLSHQIFEYQESLLTANGFRVVSMDLRGFGASDAPACGYGYDRMADDIYTVVRALNLRCFTLVGFSMGGGIVTRYMGRYNGYGVKRLVLLGAASPRFTQCSDFPYGVTREAVDAWISQASTDRAQLCEQFGSMLFARLPLFWRYIMQKAISKYWPVFVLPTLIAFIIGFIWPFIWGIFLSFQRFTTVSKTTFVGIQNYISVFQDSTFLHAFGFTAAFTVVSTVLINVCAFAIAIVLTRGIKGTNIFRTVYFMPNLIGGILLGYIWQILLNGVLANLQKPLLALDAKAGFVGLVILMCWQQIGYMMII